MFFVDRASQENVEGHHVFVLTRKPPIESVVSARSGRLVTEGNDRVLRLEHGQRNEANALTGDHTLASFERYRVLVGETAARSAQEAPAKTMTTLDLMRAATPRHRAELAWRFGMLIAAANLLLLGVGLAATQPRRASNWNLMLALLTFVTYFNLVNLSQAWIAAGRYEAGPLMGLIHGGACLLGMGLIWWRDHGVVWRPSRRRSGA